MFAPSALPLPSSIAAAVEAVRGRIRAAGQRGPHAAPTVDLIAVTKSQPVAVLASLEAAGVRDVGENRVPEALRRRRAAGTGLRWHGIGHIQRNKAREALSAFDVLHAVDNLPLARRLEALLGPLNRRVPIYIQVNASREAQKGGLAPHAAPAFLAELLAVAPHLEPVGWMTMAAEGAEEGDLRQTFRTLRALRDEVRSRGLGDPPPAGLSMGMSDDFEIAVEEGATAVRVGRALFAAERVEAHEDPDASGGPA